MRHSKSSLALHVAALVGLLVVTLGFSSPLRLVLHGRDSGFGSFRQAVEDANADANVRWIVFRPNLHVTLDSDVIYSGAQSLVIAGNGGELTPSVTQAPAVTWDGGLLVSTGGANLAIDGLAFVDSVNNGLAVFLPEDETGTVRLGLSNVIVSGARFHGVFFDGQLTTGFNTDDVLHPDCEDPYPVDSPASMRIALRSSDISGNGTLAGGFDTGRPFDLDGETVLTGCPADFDGVRVDDGGPGGIFGVVTHSTVDGNLADGIEFDDTGDGSVTIVVIGGTINANGETGTDDLDDGLDLDEAGAGGLTAYVLGTTLRDNRDEGLDFDEEGEGDAFVLLSRVDSSANEDEGFKVDEEDGGSLTVRVLDSTITGSLSQDGVDLTEEGDGDFTASFARVTITGNDGDAIDADQEDAGVGELMVIDSDLTGNANPSLDIGGITETLIRTLVD